MEPGFNTTDHWFIYVLEIEIGFAIYLQNWGVLSNAYIYIYDIESNEFEFYAEGISDYVSLLDKETSFNMSEPYQCNYPFYIPDSGFLSTVRQDSETYVVYLPNDREVVVFESNYVFSSNIVYSAGSGSVEWYNITDGSWHDAGMHAGDVLFYGEEMWVFNGFEDCYIFDLHTEETYDLCAAIEESGFKELVEQNSNSNLLFPNWEFFLGYVSLKNVDEKSVVAIDFSNPTGYQVFEIEDPDNCKIYLDYVHDDTVLEIIDTCGVAYTILLENNIVYVHSEYHSYTYTPFSKGGYNWAKLSLGNSILIINTDTREQFEFDIYAFDLPSETLFNEYTSGPSLEIICEDSSSNERYFVFQIDFEVEEVTEQDTNMEPETTSAHTISSENETNYDLTQNSESNAQSESNEEHESKEENEDESSPEQSDELESQQNTDSGNENLDSEAVGCSVALFGIIFVFIML
eukprot:TRINITY_DN2798_c0_g1_i1.p1 TRINITY_DN2798_c0_g1~~TRINITY_DN2798_c0_g1_i1.p1  ORF type:complete len:509 (-),score=124.03 TRINITY_DN2798_c0_g1_i1:19-1401(-)